MKHPNVAVLEKIYADFHKGDVQAVVAACAPNMIWNLAGKSALAGKFTNETVISGFFAKLGEISKGTLQFEAHDLMATDRHAVALCCDTLQKNGDKVQTRSVHVWRFENGKPVAWYEYPRDMYQFDAIWS